MGKGGGGERVSLNIAQGATLVFDPISPRWVHWTRKSTSTHFSLKKTIFNDIFHSVPCDVTRTNNKSATSKSPGSFSLIDKKILLSHVVAFMTKIYLKES